MWNVQKCNEIEKKNESGYQCTVSIGGNMPVYTARMYSTVHYFYCVYPFFYGGFRLFVYCLLIFLFYFLPTSCFKLTNEVIALLTCANVCMKKIIERAGELGEPPDMSDRQNETRERKGERERERE